MSRAGIAVALLLWCLLGAGQASADHRDQLAAALPETEASDHFVFHYRTAGESAIGPSELAEFIQLFEGAWDKNLAESGFPPPKPDDDGKVDVYVIETETAPGLAIRDHGDGNPGQTATIRIDPQILRSEAGKRSIAHHELLHVQQLGIVGRSLDWVGEATAIRWEYRAGVESAEPYFLRQPSIPLGCFSVAGCAITEGLADQWRGYSRWVFFQHLAELYGEGIDRELFERAAAAPGATGTDVLEAAIVARGSTLAGELSVFGSRLVSGVWSHAALAGTQVEPQLALATYAGPRRVEFSLKPLASQFVNLTSAVRPCAPVQLVMTVTRLPVAAGTPSVRVGGPGAPRALAVAGNSAQAELPFDTCATALLAVPNGSREPEPVMTRVSARITAPAAELAVEVPEVVRRRFFRVRLEPENATVLSVLATARRERNGQTYKVSRELPVRSGSYFVTVRLSPTAPRGRYDLTFLARSAAGRSTQVEAVLRVKRPR